jgi:hypothetical protein
LSKTRTAAAALAMFTVAVAPVANGSFAAIAQTVEEQKLSAVSNEDNTVTFDFSKWTEDTTVEEGTEGSAKWAFGEVPDTWRINAEDLTVTTDGDTFDQEVEFTVTKTANGEETSTTYKFRLSNEQFDDATAIDGVSAYYSAEEVNPDAPEAGEDTDAPADETDAPAAGEETEETTAKETPGETTDDPADETDTLAAGEETEEPTAEETTEPGPADEEETGDTPVSSEDGEPTTGGDQTGENQNMPGETESATEEENESLPGTTDEETDEPVADDESLPGATEENGESVLDDAESADEEGRVATRDEVRDEVETVTEAQDQDNVEVEAVETTSTRVQLATTGAPVGAISAAVAGLIASAGGAAAYRRRR